MKEFINKLKELREEKGIQQKELAEILDVSKSTISGWEVGRNEPQQEMLIKIATFFDVTTDYLLGREDEFGNIAISSGNVSGNNNTVNSHNVIHSNNNFSSEPLTSEERELLRLWNNADKKKRNAILQLLQ